MHRQMAYATSLIVWEQVQLRFKFLPAEGTYCDVIRSPGIMPAIDTDQVVVHKLRKHQAHRDI